MHEKMFSIQIFQYFRQIPPRVCTLVLFIIEVVQTGQLQTLPDAKICTSTRDGISYRIRALLWPSSNGNQIAEQYVYSGIKF